MRSSGRAGSAPWDIQPIESTGRSWRSGFKNDPRLTWRRLGRPAQNDSRSHGRSVWLARLWPVAFLSRLASRSSKRTILAPRTVTPVVSFILYSITYPRISDPRIPHLKPESGHAITRTAVRVSTIRPISCALVCQSLPLLLWIPTDQSPCPSGLDSGNHHFPYTARPTPWHRCSGLHCTPSFELAISSILSH